MDYALIILAVIYCIPIIPTYMGIFSVWAEIEDEVLFWDRFQSLMFMVFMIPIMSILWPLVYLDKDKND